MESKFVIWIRIIESTYLKSFFVSLKMKVVNTVLLAIAYSKDLTNKHTYFRCQSSSVKKFVPIRLYVKSACKRDEPSNLKGVTGYNCLIQ